MEELIDKCLVGKSRNYYQHLTKTKEALERIIDIEKKPAIERTLSEKELLKKFENNLAEIQKLFREFGDKCKPEPVKYGNRWEF